MKAAGKNVIGRPIYGRGSLYLILSQFHGPQLKAPNIGDLGDGGKLMVHNAHGRISPHTSCSSGNFSYHLNSSFNRLVLFYMAGFCWLRYQQDVGTSSALGGLWSTPCKETENHTNNAQYSPATAPRGSWKHPSKVHLSIRKNRVVLHSGGAEARL